MKKNLNMKREGELTSMNSKKDFNLDDDVLQLLVGGLMGDSYLYRTTYNSHYSYGHSPKQKDYFFWKAKIIEKNFRITTRLRFNPPNHKIYVLRTNSSPTLTRLHKMFYVKSNKPKRRWQKIITHKILNYLTPLGIAIWYCDDGTYCVRDRTCNLATLDFTFKENKIIKNYFFRKWKIKSSIIKFRRKNPDKIQYFISFNRKQTEKFLFLIKDFIPDSMIYKLGALSDKNKLMLESEDKRYKSIRKKWYYENRERALNTAARFRTKHRNQINKDRRNYYKNNLEKSRELGRKTMQKRRQFKRESVNVINKNYYTRNKDRINKRRRERWASEPSYRKRLKKTQRKSYQKSKHSKGVKK